jgi:hypothetical protein
LLHFVIYAVAIGGSGDGGVVGMMIMKRLCVVTLFAFWQSPYL